MLNAFITLTHTALDCNQHPHAFRKEAASKVLCCSTSECACSSCPHPSCCPALLSSVRILMHKSVHALGGLVTTRPSLAHFTQASHDG